MNPMTPKQIQDMQRTDQKVFVLDARSPKQYISSHIPGSVHVPMQAQFAIWSAFLIDPKKGEKIILVVEPGKEKEAITKLARTGLDCVIGYLDGGYARWQAEKMPTAQTDILTYSSAADFESESKDSRIIDVRNLGEWNDGILPRAEL